MNIIANNSTCKNEITKLTQENYNIFIIGEMFISY